MKKDECEWRCVINKVMKGPDGWWKKRWKNQWRWLKSVEMGSLEEGRERRRATASCITWLSSSDTILDIRTGYVNILDGMRVAFVH